MKKKYFVKLNTDEVCKLNKILTNESLSAKHHKFARLLLAMDEAEKNGISDFKTQISTGVSDGTIARIRKMYVEGGLDKVFEKKFTPRPSRRKFDGDKE